ncbi:hypothetical protein [Eudoraea sp.]|uniref:hypothetical protein n=1 Tax=Eudoraea sp. TaxID=1979955 RepID=UPI003C760C7A
MKIATYNIQNLFHRNKELIKENRLQKQHFWNEELESLFTKGDKTEKNYVRMRELAVLLGFNKAPFEPYVSIKNLEGNLMVETSPLTSDNRASYYSDWNGWIKLATNPIRKAAILNKAKVINEINPDILFLQEVESRTSLIQFNSLFLKREMQSPYTEIIHMEGNGSRGNGIGVLMKKGCRVTTMCSFANERDLEDEPLFDKNVMQFRITTDDGYEFFVLCCQLMDESNLEISDKKRKRQANKVGAIYKELQTNGHDNIIVLGNLNAPCYSSSLSSLLQDTDLKDIVKHNSFEADLDLGNHSGYFRMGGYRKGINIKQKDYLLLSSFLFQRVNDSGLNRKAVWPSKMPKWPLYESVKNELDSASDHPLIWSNLSDEDSGLQSKKIA